MPINIKYKNLHQFFKLDHQKVVKGQYVTVKGIGEEDFYEATKDLRNFCDMTAIIVSMAGMLNIKETPFAFKMVDVYIRAIDEYTKIAAIAYLSLTSFNHRPYIISSYYSLKEKETFVNSIHEIEKLCRDVRGLVSNYYHYLHSIKRNVEESLDIEERMVHR